MESATGQELRCPSVHMLTQSCNPHKSATGNPRASLLSSPLVDHHKPSSGNHKDSMPQGSPSSPSQAEVFEPHGSVAGILYKWVNFGKGWRVRWFVLKDGVLSYYKVHGPDKITLSDEKYTTSRIIGEESQKLIKKQRNIHRPRKSFGEVHLQVASIRKSSSDDKKLYIFTGTKTLHLRAENKDDRRAWLEVLFAAKDYVQGGVTKQASAPPSFQTEVSTKLLRNRLLQEGVAESVIVDCEEILRSEFSVLLKHLKILEDNHINLLEKLKQLEGEKLELETTVVDESQSKASAEGDVLVEEGQGASEADTDDERDVSGGLEGESEEDDNVFFDTNEILCSDSLCSSSTLSREDSVTSCGERGESSSSLDEASGNSMELVGFGYPHVERRKRLPEPKERERGVSLWSMIKDNIGKDLTKICLPVYFNEPLSSLQKCFEDLEYSYLLDRACAWGKQENRLMQILNIAAFAVSGYSSTEGRACKPFNPLLGETYEADYPDKGVRFISEKVSHHPMIVACHCEGKDWLFWGDCDLKSKFWGRSIQLDPTGQLTLEFSNGQRFQWSKVTTAIYNLIIGKLYCDHYGTMRIQGNGDLFCKIKFKEQSILDRNPHQIQGYVYDKEENKLASLFGKWDEAVYFVLGDIAIRGKAFDPMSEATLLWRINNPPEFPTRYNLTSFAITLNEITPGLQEMLPPTDSRLRPDQRHLENGEFQLANAEKLRLEQKQRQARKLQERGWQPRWFCKNDGNFVYRGGYWEAREQKNWSLCPDVFGTDAISV
ncbi:hypothetical protein GOP47_0005120 [Adiantum capillus-veneris]|uniref:PH domain-containing protein n=1 Tax=Adiantum capillus-veneris TaxID=13818 RepID=A0A9D4V5D7_ADICA|nr:hypothetical protein GOP47_0005120 [Adiantum capillus-veneris]